MGCICTCLETEPGPISQRVSIVKIFIELEQCWSWCGEQPLGSTPFPYKNTYTYKHTALMVDQRAWPLLHIIMLIDMKTHCIISTHQVHTKHSFLNTVQIFANFLECQNLGPMTCLTSMSHYVLFLGCEYYR